MASQFTVYSSNDAGGPLGMAGAAGELIRILDAVLVDGYPGKSAAGWTKPIANSGNIGCYVNASPANGGNGFGLVINDNGPNGTSTYKEAWAIGWESVAGIGAPVGSGSGQFPTPAQLLTTGHVVVRKSVAASAVVRDWICFADSLTFYLFIASGDFAGFYMPFWFGDFFSLGGSGDDFRCMIQGRTAENSGAVGTAVDSADCIHTFNVSAANSPGCYCPRTSGGGGTAVQMLKSGGVAFMGAPGTAGVFPTAGLLQTPNGSDNAYYLPPIWISQITVNQMRGRFRGLYHSGHPVVTFADGQVVNGAADYAGKTLQAVAKGLNGGMWFVETSNTVETN